MKRKKEGGEEESEEKKARGTVAEEEVEEKTMTKRGGEDAEDKELKRLKRREGDQKREREEVEEPEEEDKGKNSKRVLIGLAEKMDVNKEEAEETEWALGDVDGRSIDVKVVREARSEEMTFMKRHPVFEEVDVEECGKTRKNTDIH